MVAPIKLNKKINQTSFLLRVSVDSNTGHVKGRSIADNLRSINFLKDCNEVQVDSVLISLDAKKAFDSVDHGYVETTLRKYGFGENLINYIKTLYNGLSAKLMINGFRSKMIRILRGMKQGDSLNCAIFIICIDPLIRNLNADIRIREIELKTNITKQDIKFKAGAFADDVGALCRSDNASIQSVFEQYEKLTKRSGL